MKSRWVDDEEDEAAESRRKLEKEEKKRAKAEKQRKLEEAETQRQQQALAASSSTKPQDDSSDEVENERPVKRRKISPDTNEQTGSSQAPAKLLRFQPPEWGPCRHVDNFERLNHIEEGSYGWVSRARESATGEVVALKKLKMDNANDGFPVTGLREIQTLMESRHPNIVYLREVVVGDGLDE